MKIAVLYSGHIRTWDQCIENQIRNISIDTADLYFHTFTKPNGVSCKLFTPIQGNYYLPDEAHKYNANRRPESFPHNVLNQWHNNFIGFSLVPTDYDVYVKCRCDIEFNSKINFNDYIFLDDKVYIPNCNHFWGINDQFAFGNYKAMKKYINVYTNSDEIFNQGVQFNPEAYVKKNLEMQNVTIIKIPQKNHIYGNPV